MSARAIDSATAALTLAEELGSKGRIVAMLKERVRAHIAANDPDAAAQDIARAPAGMDPSSKDAYLRSQRTQLEELRGRLRSEADPGPSYA